MVANNKPCNQTIPTMNVMMVLTSNLTELGTAQPQIVYQLIGKLRRKTNCFGGISMNIINFSHNNKSVPNCLKLEEKCDTR